LKFAVNDPDNKEFQISGFSILETQKTRNIIALTLLSVCVIFLLTSAIYGLIKGHFTALETVLTYTDVPLGVLIGYYFGAKNG
jgi:hypothetical protein